MGIIRADISVSLDGYSTGPNDSVETPLGEGGERLHEWIFGLDSWRERHGLEGGESNPDAEIIDETFRNVGAFVMGRRMFEHGQKPWGVNPPFHLPVFVLTHHARSPLVKEGGTTFYFVADGLESALRQAKKVAGDKDISISGGANVIQQALQERVLDELQIHIIPVLFGGGRPLFEHLGTAQRELEATRVIASPGVTHLKFRVIK